MKLHSTIITILLFCSFYISHAQKDSLHKYDSIITRMLLRNIDFPDCCEKWVGVVLFEVDRNDSVIALKPLYLSNSAFDITQISSYISKGLYKLYATNKDALKNKYRTIVPIYFYYGDDEPLPPSKEILDIVNKKVDKLEKKRKTIVLKPIKLYGYGVVHRICTG